MLRRNEFCTKIKAAVRKSPAKVRGIISLAICLGVVIYFADVFSRYKQENYDYKSSMLRDEVEAFVYQIDQDLLGGTECSWDVAGRDRDLIIGWIEHLDQRPGVMAILTDQALNIVSERFFDSDEERDAPFDLLGMGNSDYHKIVPAIYHSPAGEATVTLENGALMKVAWQAVPTQKAVYYIFVGIDSLYVQNQLDEKPFQLGIGFLVLVMLALSVENVGLRWQRGKYKNGPKA